MSAASYSYKEVFSRPDARPPSVVVIGGGLAGLSAANEAIKRGAKVILVEKEAIGGNSAKATSGINAVLSTVQKEAIEKGLVQDDIETFREDVVNSGHGLCKPALAHALTALSGPSLDTMCKDFDLDLTELQMLGGHRSKRTHRFPPKNGRAPPVGWTVVSTLKKHFLAAVEQGKAEALIGYALTDFELHNVKDDRGNEYPAVKRIELTNKDDQTTKVINDATAYIFSAGGYAANSAPSSLVARYRPDLMGFPTTNGDFASGDILQLGLKRGLKAVDLDKIQLHPTGLVDPKAPGANRKFLCPEVVRGLGAILVNTDGKRFANELLRRDDLSQVILANGSSPMEWGISTDTDDKQKVALLIMPDSLADRLGRDVFNFYMGKSFFFKINAQGGPECPKLSLETIRATISEYNEAVRGEKPDPFGKVSFPIQFGDAEQIYGAYITPSLHFTMGGLEIDAAARALTLEKKPVMNLFVVGETSGGVHGGNRLGGNGCLESLTFGQLAARQATTLRAGDEKMVAAYPSAEGKDERELVVLEADSNRLILALSAANQKMASGTEVTLCEVTTRDLKRATIKASLAESQELGTMTLEMTEPLQNVHPGDIAKVMVVRTKT